MAGDEAREVGYRLRREAWGRGLATEGARALVRVGILDLQAAMVDACALPANNASIAVMRKCGMSFLGTFGHPRADAHVVRYGLTRADFDRLQGG